MLFCPLFIRGNHWALLVFEMKSKTIKYFDSIYGPDSSIIDKITLCLSKYIDKLKGCEFWKLSPETSYPKQQANGTDCGVFTCLYAKYLAFNRPFDFNQSDIPNFRNVMSSEIMKYEIESDFILTH